MSFASLAPEVEARILADVRAGSARRSNRFQLPDAVDFSPADFGPADFGPADLDPA